MDFSILNDIDNQVIDAFADVQATAMEWGLYILTLTLSVQLFVVVAEAVISAYRGAGAIGSFIEGFVKAIALDQARTSKPTSAARDECDPSIVGQCPGDCLQF